jgi:AI-2E family transporter
MDRRDRSHSVRRKCAFVTIFGAFLTVVLLFYFLLNGPAIARGLLRLARPGQRPLIRHVWSQADPVLRRYILGVLGVIAYATVAAYIRLGLMLAIPHAVFLALLTGHHRPQGCGGDRWSSGTARCASGIGRIIIFCFSRGRSAVRNSCVILAMPAALVIRTTLAILYDEPPVVDRNHQ